MMSLTGSFNHSAYGIITTNIFITFMEITIIIITVIFFIVIIRIIIMYFSLAVSCFYCCYIHQFIITIISLEISLHYFYFFPLNWNLRVNIHNAAIFLWFP